MAASDEGTGRDGRLPGGEARSLGDDGAAAGDGSPCPEPDEGSSRDGARHLVWHIEILGERYRLSWVDRAFDTGCPELMAFHEDAEGGVTDWDEVASSFDADPVRAYAEVVARLREETAARLMDEL